MRILICGGRDYGEGDDPARKAERAAFAEAFAKLVEKHGDGMVMINGGCPTGADKMARMMALHCEIEFETYPAKWKTMGKRAGPVRNQYMVDKTHPQAGVALPGGSGTSDCVKRMRAAGIPVWIPYGGVNE